MTFDIGINQTEIGWGEAYISEADARTVCEGIASLRVPRVRLEAAWKAIEPERGTYVWTETDRAVAIALDSGLKPLLICGVHRPGWSGQSAADYGNLCRQIAKRYGVDGFTRGDTTYLPVVTDYELWNEPNLMGPFSFWPYSVARYADYVKAGYEGIKGVQPSNSIVMTGGFHGGCGNGTIPFLGSTKDALQFLSEMYDHGVQGHFDAISNHPYSTDTGFNHLPPTPDGPAFIRELAMRELMDSMGDSDKPIWWTEWGFYTALWSQAEQVTHFQAQWDIYLDRLATGQWGPAFIYNYRDSSNKPDAKNSSFGLVEHDFTPKLAFDWVDGLNPPANIPVTLFGVGNLSATVTPGRVAALTGAGTLSAGASSIQFADAALSGSGSLSVELFGRPAANLKGAGVLSASVKPVFARTAPLSGVGTLSAGVDLTPRRDADLSGEGALLAGVAQQKKYEYTFTGSTKPTALFTSFGEDYHVTGGVANNDEPTHSNGTYYSGAIYKLDQISADHFAQVTQAGGSITARTSAMALVRADASGANWVGCTGRWGGNGSVQIQTCIDGVVVERATSNHKFSNNDVMRLEADGNTYTVSRNGEVILIWSDINSVYTGAGNRRTGFGFQHRWANGQYDSPGIKGTWYGWDLRATTATLGGADLSGSGLLSAASMVKLPAVLSGSGSLAAAADEVGVTPERNAVLSGVGTLSVVSKVNLTANLSAAGVLAGATVDGHVDAQLSGEGGLVADVTVPVGWVSTGAGHRTTSFGSTSLSTSWLHTIATSGPDVVAVAFGEFYRLNTGTVAPAATYGGVPMTFVGMEQSASAFGTAAFILFNPPDDAQTVVFTPGGSSTKYLAQGVSVAYGHASGVSDLVSLASTSDSTPSIDIPSELGAKVVAAIDRVRASTSPTNISSVTGTERYIDGGLVQPSGSASDGYIYLSAQDAPGAESVTLGATTGAGTSRGLGFALNPAPPIPARMAQLKGAGALSCLVEDGTPQRTAQLSGGGTLAAATAAAVGANLTGAGTVTADVEMSGSVNAELSGQGVLSAAAHAVFSRTAILIGGGTLTATAAGVHHVNANLTGSGTLSATAEEVAGIDFIDADGNGGASVTSMPSHQTGNLLLLWAVREGSATPPTLAAGWTSILTETRGTNSVRLAYKIAASGSETSGSWTNADTVLCASYHGVSAIGASDSTNATSATITIPALTLDVTDGTSWVAGFAAATDTAASLTGPPATMTTRLDFAGTGAGANAGEQDAGIYDTDQGVASWSAQTFGISVSSIWMSIAVELKA